MNIDPLAITYTRALVELAREADRLRPVLEEIRFLGSLLREVGDFRAFLEIPSIDVGAKREVLERAFRGKLDDLTVNFLELILDKKRQFLLPQIFAAMEDLYDEEVGRAHVKAVTAVPLEPALKDEIARVLQARYGREVILVNVVRPEVLGGLVLRWRDLVADGSVRTALEKIGRGMESSKLGSELVHEN